MQKQSTQASLNLSISYAADSPARISARAVRRLALKVIAAVSGLKCSASFASFDPRSCSWRTSQISLFSDSTACSLDLPLAGMMQSGCLSELTILDRLTEDGVSSLWPTPTHRDAKLSRRHGYMLTGNAGTTLTDAVISHHGLELDRKPGEHTEAPAGPNPEFCEVLMGFPPKWTELD